MDAKKRVMVVFDAKDVPKQGKTVDVISFDIFKRYRNTYEAINFNDVERWLKRSGEQPLVEKLKPNTQSVHKAPRRKKRKEKIFRLTDENTRTDVGNKTTKSGSNGKGNEALSKKSAQKDQKKSVEPIMPKRFVDTTFTDLPLTKIRENPKYPDDDIFDRAERLHYEEVREWMEERVNASQAVYVGAIQEFKKYDGNVKDNIQPIREAIGYKNLSEATVEDMERLIDRPYFAHVEIMQAFDGEETEKEVLYIGNQMLSADNADIIVYSWTTELANKLYYEKRITPFILQTQDTLGKYVNKIEPLMRRAVTITDGKYESYINEFMSEKYIQMNGLENIAAAGEQISDAFLLQVLAEKKDNDRMTDIIRTIQTQQNKVIRREAAENFIVQGCAGSGKTMILLHRLSFLLDRQFLQDTEEPLIITPSQEFNEQVKELARELRIQKIPVMTVDGFYRDLLKKLGWISSGGGNAKNELQLDKELLKRIYSIAFVENLKECYNHMQHKAINAYSKDMDRFAVMAERLQMTDADKVKTLQTLDECTVYLKNIQDKNREVQESVRVTEAQITSMIRAQGNSISKENEAGEKLAAARNELAEYLTETILKRLEKYVKQEKRQLEIKMRNRTILPEEITFEMNRLTAIEDVVRKLKRKDIEEYFSNADSRETILDMVTVANNDRSDNTLKNGFAAYDKALGEIKESGRRKEYQAQEVQKLDQILAQLKEQQLSAEDLRFITQKMKAMQGKLAELRNVQHTFEYEVQPELEAMFLQYGETYAENYRCVWFAKLWWSVVYGEKLPTGHLFCIDEAQNISAAEYRLFKALHSTRSVWNLYGDVYQNTTPERGIQQWSEIRSEVLTAGQMGLYEFDENYRNTNQITDYVNDRVDLPIKMKAIGYNAAIVDRITEEELEYAVDWSLSKYKNIVYITKKTSTKIKNEIAGLAERYKKDIQIMHVDQVKGMEFRAVIVDDADMTENEKYIAYTRATDELVVIEQ